MTDSQKAAEGVDISFHYMIWEAFSRIIFEKTFTAEDIIDIGKEHLIKDVQVMTYHGDSVLVKEDVPVRRKFIKFAKHGKKYLLPVQVPQMDDSLKLIIDMLPLNVTGFQEIQIKKSDSEVHRLVGVRWKKDELVPENHLESLNMRGEKTMEYWEFIDTFNRLPSTNAKDQEFILHVAMGSKAKGVKCCICSPPAGMKNAFDTLINSITRNTVRVAHPTLAKLETSAYFNQKLMPDEMTSLAAAEVRQIESFFLTIADESPQFTKHSMAPQRDMNKVDISMLSCVFTYNRVNDLKEGSLFFDDIWQNKAAFRSRYPAFLLDTTVKVVFPKLNMAEAEVLLVEHMPTVKKYAKMLIYSVNNMNKMKHGWDTGYLALKGRHLANVQGIVDSIDCRCKTQEEFNEWMLFMNNSVVLYNRMVNVYDKQDTFGGKKYEIEQQQTTIEMVRMKK